MEIEEAQSQRYMIETREYNMLSMRELIVKIYDDFESRTCNNCVNGHYTDRQNNDIWCLKDDSPVYDCNVEIDFGCNKFERKQDE